MDIALAITAVGILGLAMLVLIRVVDDLGKDGW